MIKNLRHAAMGVAAILLTGWLLAQPSIQRSMSHAKYGHVAAWGILAGLALIVVLSVVAAVKHRKPEAPVRHTYPFAAGRK
jgi:uncharacterized membrane protein